jgi:hypothetical protein
MVYKNSFIRKKTIKMITLVLKKSDATMKIEKKLKEIKN